MVKKILCSLFLILVLSSCSNKEDIRMEDKRDEKISIDSKYKISDEEVDKNGIKRSDLTEEEKNIYDLLYRYDYRLNEAESFSYTMKAEDRVTIPDDEDKILDLTATSTTTEGQVFQDKKGNIKAIVKSTVHVYGEKSTNEMTLYSMKNGEKYDNYQYRNDKWRYIRGNDEALLSNFKENLSKYYKKFSFNENSKDKENSKYKILQAYFNGKEILEMKGAKDVKLASKGPKPEDIHYYYFLFFDQNDKFVKIMIDSSESYAAAMDEKTKDDPGSIAKSSEFKSTMTMENIELNQVKEILLPKEAEKSKANQ